MGEAALLAEGGTRSASIQAEKLVQVCTSQLLSRLLCCSPWHAHLPRLPVQLLLLGLLHMQWQKHPLLHLCCSASRATVHRRERQWQHTSLAVLLPHRLCSHALHQ